MAQQLQKLFQSGGGIPKGTGIGLQLLGTAAVIGYGISQSLYTGSLVEDSLMYSLLP